MENVLKYLPLIENSKQDIINGWVEDCTVKRIFKQHSIDIKLFANHFAVRILDYFIGVAKCCEEAGQCPAINVMLKFFYHKNITLDEVFLICDGFKKSVFITLEKNKQLSLESINSIFILFGSNFAGVIKEFINEKISQVKTKEPKGCCDEVGKLDCENKSKDEQGKNEQNLNEQTKDVTYLKNLTDDIENLDSESIKIDKGDLSALDELEEKLADYVDLYYNDLVTPIETARFISNLELLGDRLIVFGAKRFGSAFLDFTFLMRKFQPQIDLNIGKLIHLFEAMQNDVKMWMTDIATNQDTFNIEASMMANFEQMKVIICNEGGSETELF